MTTSSPWDLYWESIKTKLPDPPLLAVPTPKYQHFDTVFDGCRELYIIGVGFDVNPSIPLAEPCYYYLDRDEIDGIPQYEIESLIKRESKPYEPSNDPFTDYWASKGLETPEFSYNQSVAEKLQTLEVFEFYVTGIYYHHKTSKFGYFYASEPISRLNTYCSYWDSLFDTPIIPFSDALWINFWKTQGYESPPVNMEFSVEFVKNLALLTRSPKP